MSIIKPHKLGIISGPGSEYFSGKVVKHLRRLYLERYNKLSSAMAKRHGLSEEEILKTVMLLDDLNKQFLREGCFRTRKVYLIQDHMCGRVVFPDGDQ